MCSRGNHFLLLCAGLLVHFVLSAFFPQSAYAYRRGKQPFPIALMLADTIVAAEVTTPTMLVRRTGRTVTLEYTMGYKVGETLKGDAAKLPNPISLHQWYDADLGQIGERQRFLLFFSNGRLLMDGTGLDTPELRQRTLTGMANLPPWSEPIHGLALALVPSDFNLVEADDLDLHVLVRNTSDTTITLHYQNTPVTDSTWWELQIKDQNARKIAPLRHPHLNAQQLAEFEKAQKREYDVSLSPGNHQTYTLRDINSARSGYGYKEELNFQYYPLPAGTYEIEAIAHRLMKDVQLRSSPLTITINK